MDEVFRFILSVAAHKGPLWGEAIGIDSTTIQANASMRSIVRKDSGKGWKDYTKKLAKKAGLDDPTSLQGPRALLQLAWTHFDQLISAWERVVTPLARYGAHSSTATGG